ncbi:MAG: NAD-dependent epimerase/dehydratase family protein [Limisphaerales bacterium]
MKKAPPPSRLGGKLGGICQRALIQYFRINTEGTRHVLEAAKAAGVRRFVFFSTIKAMSSDEGWRREDGGWRIEYGRRLKPAATACSRKLEPAASACVLCPDCNHVVFNLVLRGQLGHSDQSRASAAKRAKTGACACRHRR